MDQIRPIGPPERDIDPVVRIPRTDRDGQKDRPDPREGREQEPPPRQPPPSPAPENFDDPDGPSHIDVRVWDEGIRSGPSAGRSRAGPALLRVPRDPAARARPRG